MFHVQQALVGGLSKVHAFKKSIKNVRAFMRFERNKIQICALEMPQISNIVHFKFKVARLNAWNFCSFIT